MVRTVRYKVVDGKRIFVSYDSLCVDPVATEKAAMRAVDKTRLKNAISMLRQADPNVLTAAEYEAIASRVRYELWSFKKAVHDYAVKNPIHFQPRAHEQIICPLLAEIGQRDNTDPID